MHRSAAPALALALLLASCGASPGGSDPGKVDDPGKAPLTSIPAVLRGIYLEVGTKNEIYVADTYVKRSVPRLNNAPLETTFAFGSASYDEAAGLATAACGEFGLASKNDIVLATISDGEPFFIVRKAPLNTIKAAAMYQSTAAGRALSSAAGISLVIRNVLQTETKTVAADATDGSFSIPGAVPGDAYTVTPQLPGGVVAPSFTVVSTPNMSECPGGTIAIPQAGVAGAFKATLRYDSQSAPEGTFVDEFAYHYAGLAYKFKLEVQNVGEADSLASVAVAWTGASSAPTAFAGLAGAYAKGEKKSADLELVAESPAGEAEYSDLLGSVTMGGTGGLEWKDEVGHRFYVNERATLAMKTFQAVSVTIIDPEGKTTAIAGDPFNQWDAAATFPRRKAGYRVGVMHHPSSYDVLYSLALEGRTMADGIARVAAPTAVADYGSNPALRLSFEDAGATNFGNDAPPASLATAAEAQIIRPGESVVSSLAGGESVADVDWWALGFDAARGTSPAVADASFPLAAEPYQMNGSGRLVGPPTLALDADDLPHVFFYSWIMAKDEFTNTYEACGQLLLEHAWRSASGSWSRETVADLSDPASNAAPLRRVPLFIDGLVSAFPSADGSWKVAFCSWHWLPGDERYDDVAEARPRIATGSPGGPWTVGPAPTDPNLIIDLSTHIRSSAGLAGSLNGSVWIAETATMRATFTAPRIVRRDPAGALHLAYRRTRVDTITNDKSGNVAFYYSTASGDSWSSPLQVNASYDSSAERNQALLYSMDLSGTAPIVWASRFGGLRAFERKVGGYTPFVYNDADQNPFGKGSLLGFRALDDGKPLFAASHFGQLLVCEAQDGTGYAGMGIVGGAAPATRGNFLFSAGPPGPDDNAKFRLVVARLDRQNFRTSHHPALVQPSGSMGQQVNTAPDLLLRLAPRADGGVWALLQWRAPYSASWGYELHDMRY